MVPWTQPGVFLLVPLYWGSGCRGTSAVCLLPVIFVRICLMTASENLADTEACTFQPRWSGWRWPLVIPAFIAGWIITNWAPYIGTRSEYQLDELIWAEYTLAGFIPVVLAGKVAPSRQLPLAIECALLVAAWIAGSWVYLIAEWREGRMPVDVAAFVLLYNFLTLTGAASAVWLVKRNRVGYPERGSTWARATGLALPVALFAAIAVEGYIT